MKVWLMGKLRMHDWDTWQTYRKDRGTPPWIKVHRSLFSNSKWAALSDAEKGQLVSIWLLAGDTDGVITDDPKVIQKQAQLDQEPNISKFIDLGLMAPSGNHMVTTCQPTGDQLVGPETEAETKRETKKDKPPTPFGFDEFWESYPNKVAKPQAIKAFLKEKPEPQALMEGVGIWKASSGWTKDGGKFIPHPATFLNRRQWENRPQGYNKANDDYWNEIMKLGENQ